MGLLSGIFGLENNEEKVVELASEKSDAVQATPTSAPNPGEDSVRISPSELELGYGADPIVFNSINKNVQTIMGAGYELDCEGDDKENILKYYNNFLKNIGIIGGNETFDEILECSFQNVMIYGRHFIENVFNKNDTQIADLISLDPKSIDYARNSSNKIVLDKYGNPVGYTQTLPYSVSIEGLGDILPENITLKPQQIFLLPERIAHLKLYTYGDKLVGLGLIEPAYKSLVRKQNIEEAQANSIYARGTYPIIDYVGTPERFPTPKMLQNATDKLSKMQHNRYFAFPYWHNVKPLEVKQSEIVDDTIKTLRENVSASLGMPLAFATGSGEATNRATLATQQKFLEFSLNDIAKRVVSHIRKTIFARMAKLKKFSNVPFIVWGDIGAENKDDKAKRITEYTKAGILPQEAGREYALRSEELLIGKSKKYEEEIKASKVKEDKLKESNEKLQKLENRLKEYASKIENFDNNKDRINLEFKDAEMKLKKKVDSIIKSERDKVILESQVAQLQKNYEKEKEMFEEKLVLEKENLKLKNIPSEKDKIIKEDIKKEKLDNLEKQLEELKIKLDKKIEVEVKEEIILKNKKEERVSDFSYEDIRKLLEEEE